MPRRSGPPGSPSDWLADGEWPDGDFKADAPEVVAYAVQIARALDEALEGQVRSHVAQSAGIERSTLYDILAGNTWPDMVTLAKLEQALSVTLWPSQPPTLPRSPRPSRPTSS
ncbi:helix-turn-helix domain-containing protein [Terrabacter sp. C0L_2]|uniref:helix-turn-helix domain-containing protein n=1 Tax=Terrabacter sp. C0L_2 TaxID=3108389 RepID=UPI0017A9BE94|nr:helix-turn-helix transcriptional regulator [Dermatophilaceae bacterium]WVM95396.1 helix-turn-helix transcriptional regulator [Terrabacter sp. C0L_2]